MKTPFVFSEFFNCGPLLRPFLESYLKYHDTVIHIVTTDEDLKYAGDIVNHKNVKIINISNDNNFSNAWKNGHAGTALCFASAILKWSNSDYIIHFDSDVIFRNDCITDILSELNNGYDIVGSPRAYRYNLSGVKGLENYHDTVSTYAFGINKTKIPNYEFDYFVRMCGGWVNPLKHRTLDFFDPVVFSALANGAKIRFLSTVEYGGMDNFGNKKNGYDTNLNFDFGSKIVHFGGVGSGCSVYYNKSDPPKSYAEWALGRWSLYAKLFLNLDTNCSFPTTYSKQNDHDGKRWCSGNYDEWILTTVLKELNK
jgi:hypothetical protein